jgi:EKC/KEOPS complex subunit CGI121/TPRKB
MQRGSSKASAIHRTSYLQHLQPRAATLQRHRVDQKSVDQLIPTPIIVSKHRPPPGIYTMETYNLDHFPPNISTVHIASFKHVANAREIRQRLIKASSMEGTEGDAERAKVDFAFLEGKVVSPQKQSYFTSRNRRLIPQLVSKSHLLTAVQTTLLNALSHLPAYPDSADATQSTSVPTPHTKSHNLHSEILLTLSPNNNITDSIRRHGITDETTHLVLVRFGARQGAGGEGEGQEETDAQEMWRQMNEVVKGELESLDELDKGESVDWSRVDKVGVVFSMPVWKGTS